MTNNVSPTTTGTVRGRFPRRFAIGILVVAPLINSVIFAVLRLLGVEYEGSSESSMYITLLALNVTGVLLLFFGSRLASRRRDCRVFGPIAFLVVVASLFALQEILGLNSRASHMTALRFAGLWVPGFLGGVVASSGEYWNRVVQWSPVVMGLFTLVSVEVTISTITLGDTRIAQASGVTYQTVSYMAAVAFGMCCYYVSLTKRAKSGVLGAPVFKILCLGLMPVQAFAAFAAGGRGGLVLVGIYLTMFLFSMLRRIRAGAMILAAVGISILALFLAERAGAVSSSALFENGAERQFLAYSADGIVWELTGRSEVYSEALHRIGDRTLFGYGLFNWGDDFPPHNLILDFWLQGGILLLVAGTGLLLSAYFRMRKLRRQNEEYGLLAVYGVYCVTILLFSGTFLLNPTFAFLVGFLFFSREPVRSTLTEI